MEMQKESVGVGVEKTEMVGTVLACTGMIDSGCGDFDDVEHAAVDCSDISYDNCYCTSSRLVAFHRQLHLLLAADHPRFLQCLIHQMMLMMHPTMTQVHQSPSDAAAVVHARDG
jgi:hypothetical protein